MSTFPGSPKLLKGGIVLIDPGSSAVVRVIVMQFSPDTLSRSFQVKGIGAESGDRSEALRLLGPPVESIKFEAEIDATDQLEFPAQNPSATQFGIYPQLAALEMLIYPSSTQLNNTNRMAGFGMIEIAPVETPLALFVWSANRVLPVNVTELSVTEEAFDQKLNPIRAKVSVGLRVLSVDDLGFAHKGGNLFMNYLQKKEALAEMTRGAVSAFGITGIP